MSERLSCGASFGNVKISDLDFRNDAVIFAETLDILFRALEEPEKLGLQASEVYTKIQGFIDNFDAAIISAPVCGEYAEVTERFTYLLSDIHVSAGCEPEVNRRLGRAWGVMDSLDHSVWCCCYLQRRMNVRVFRSLVLPVLLYRCENRTLNKGLRWKLNSIGTRSLQRILGSRWLDFVFNERFLRETQIIFVTCIVYECWLQLYGRMAYFPDANPAHQILSGREPYEWRRPMGRPCSSWLHQVNQHLKEMGMGKAAAWGMARWGPWSTGGKWTQRCAALSHAPKLDLT